MRERFSTSRAGIIQSIFIGSLRKRVEELLNYSGELKDDLYSYLSSGKWPNMEEKRLILLSWYLQWFNIPAASVVKTAVEKVKAKLTPQLSSVPLLRLLFPGTHIDAINEIDKLCFSSHVIR